MNIPIYPRQAGFPGKEMSPSPSLGVVVILLFLSELTLELGEL